MSGAVRFGWQADGPCGSLASMDHGIDVSSQNVVTGRTVVFTSLGMGALLFVFNDLLGLINGGGLFSAAAAVKAAHSGMLWIHVDQASLRTPIVISCALITTTICMLLRLHLENRWVQLFFTLCIVGGGFLIDAVYGSSIIEAHLRNSGYVRCGAQDHAVGNGKGRVWLHSYVQSGSEACSRST